jgi:hypothetical protein
MSALPKLSDLTDPDVAFYCSDAYGDVMTAVYVHDLDDWAFALGRIEDWIANAEEETHDDYARHVAERYGRHAGPQLPELMWMVGTMAARMRALVDGAPT